MSDGKQAKRARQGRNRSPSDCALAFLDFLVAVLGSLHFPLAFGVRFHGQKNEAHRGKVLSKLVSLPLGVVPILRGKERNLVFQSCQSGPFPPALNPLQIYIFVKLFERLNGL